MAEILPISLDQKAKDIEGIRHYFIPVLSGRNYGAEKVLKTFHQLGTHHARPATSIQDALHESYIALYGHNGPVPADRYQIDQILEDIRSQGPETFSPLGYVLKGDYRILGCFAPNSYLGKYNPEAREYFTGAIPVQTKDYQLPESPNYYPPVFNVNKLMAKIGDKFDNDIIPAQTPEDVAKIASEFYFWGLVIVHPFWGANHRAFDRFLEYAFDKKNIGIKLPQSETLNIPNNDPFNLSLYRLRKAFLGKQGLLYKHFRLERWKDLPDWLKYHHDLNEAISEAMGTQEVDTDEIAENLLKWV